MVYLCVFEKGFFFISILYRQSKSTKNIGSKDFKEQNRTIIFRKKHKISRMEVDYSSYIKFDLGMSRTQNYILVKFSHFFSQFS